MKIAGNTIKRVCLLFLGLSIMAGGRCVAADISLTSLAMFADSSSTSTVGTAVASPFRDESTTAPAKEVAPAGKAVAAEPGMSEWCTPSCVAGNCCDCDNFVGAPGRIWVTGQYLSWWTSGAHLPPMASTVDANGNPVTLFGDQDIGNGQHEGYRVACGTWLDCHHCWGVEGDYFDISEKPTDYDSGTTIGNANGTAFPIYRFVNDPAAPGVLTPDVIGLVSATSPYVGRETVNTDSYFQSAGLWLRHRLMGWERTTSGGDVNWTDRSARTFRLDAIAGYRFARLIDTVNEEDDTFCITNLNGYSYFNDYRTVNNFNGGELGLDTVLTFGRWSLDVVTKCAIGVNNEYVRLYNQEIVDESQNTGVPVPWIIVNQAPLQEFSRNRFAAIPELMATAGYQVTEHLKFTVGYDLLFWTAVVRAADQIAVNPANGYPYGNVISTPAANPLPPFTWIESSFLAQGLHAGAELRF